VVGLLRFYELSNPVKDFLIPRSRKGALWEIYLLKPSWKVISGTLKGVYL
jgi:hypothetical protein